MTPPTLLGRPMQPVQVGAGPAAVQYWRAKYGSWTASVGAGNGEWRYHDQVAYSRSIPTPYDGADEAAAADLEYWMVRELRGTAEAMGYELRGAGS